MRKERIQFY